MLREILFCSGYGRGEMPFERARSNISAWRFRWISGVVGPNVSSARLMVPPQLTTRVGSPPARESDYGDDSIGQRHTNYLTLLSTVMDTS